MGTYVYAAFSHSGDPQSVFEIGRQLIEKEGFRPNADVGDKEFTLELLDARWRGQRFRDLRLQSDDHLFTLYPRGAALVHCEVRWWAFASNGFMNNGRGREDVRNRSRSMARRFGSDRILYVPDSTGINRLSDGLGIEEEEAYLLEGGPPFDWDHGVQDAGIYMRSWFRELL